MRTRRRGGDTLLLHVRDIPNRVTGGRELKKALFMVLLYVYLKGSAASIGICAKYESNLHIFSSFRCFRVEEEKKEQECYIYIWTSLIVWQRVHGSSFVRKAQIRPSKKKRVLLFLLQTPQIVSGLLALGGG